jgi:hypothetical protein
MKTLPEVFSMGWPKAWRKRLGWMFSSSQKKLSKGEDE